MFMEYAHRHAVSTETRLMTLELAGLIGTYGFLHLIADKLRYSARALYSFSHWPMAPATITFKWQ